MYWLKNISQDGSQNNFVLFVSELEIISLNSYEIKWVNTNIAGLPRAQTKLYKF